MSRSVWLGMRLESNGCWGMVSEAPTILPAVDVCCNYPADSSSPRPLLSWRVDVSYFHPSCIASVLPHYLARFLNAFCSSLSPPSVPLLSFFSLLSFFHGSVLFCPLNCCSSLVNCLSQSNVSGPRFRNLSPVITHHPFTVSISPKQLRLILPTSNGCLSCK